MQSMTIDQTVTEDDFRKAYGTFYSTFIFTRFRPWFGAVMLAFGVYLIKSQQQTLAVAIFFILFGIFLFMDKHIYVARRLHFSRRAGHLPATMQVELSDNGRLKMSGDGEHSGLNLSKLHGYQIAEVGVLIYLQRNMFFILKEDAIGQAGGIDQLLSLLRPHGVKRIR